MAKPKAKLKLVSRFPAAKEGAYDAVKNARRLALNAGEGEAEKRLERLDDTRGYELPIDVDQENIGHQSGRIFYDNWYGKFFEYGTTYIPASPFMRPASRKMRKVFLAEMGDKLEGFIGRRARVPKG